MAAKTKIIYRTKKVKHHSGGRKITPQRVLKWTIALAPVTAYAVSSYQSNGGGVKGMVGGINAVSSAYSGFDITTGKFNPATLLIGYVPIFAAWLFGKVSSRVLR